MAYNVHTSFQGRSGQADYVTTAAVDLDDTIRTLIGCDGPDWTITPLLDGVYVAQSEEADAIIHAVTQQDRDALDALIENLNASTDGLVDDMDADDEDQLLITGAPRYYDEEGDD